MLRYQSISLRHFSEDLILIGSSGDLAAFEWLVGTF